MSTRNYPSDLTDAQWALIEPDLPVYPGGRPRKTDLRQVVNAIFYVLRTGCQWRFLPKDFPPKGENGVTSYFAASSSLPLFPPGPEDSAAWRRIARTDLKPSVLRVADGLA